MYYIVTTAVFNNSPACSAFDLEMPGGWGIAHDNVVSLRYISLPSVFLFAAAVS
jgi:hypothetical protein